MLDHSNASEQYKRESIRSAPMAGYGDGLPMARLYARYFGGDIRVVSMEGYGTDVYIFLNKLGDLTEFVSYPYDNPVGVAPLSKPSNSDRSPHKTSLWD